MSDRELLELAAKACGVNVEGFSLRVDKGMRLVDADHNFVRFWNPLEDDGDALRLAIGLSLTVNPYEEAVFVSRNENEPTQMQKYDGDRYQATRRAIVWAAAEIGKAMP